MPSVPSIDQLVNDLARVTGILVRRVRAEHPHEISIPHAQAMSRLAEEGAMTTADLARAESVKPQSMGQTLAALEQEGLVARQRHPTDGRQVLFNLTRKGAELRQANKLAKRQWLSTRIAELSPDERRTLAAAVEIIWRITQ